MDLELGDVNEQPSIQNENLEKSDDFISADAADSESDLFTEAKQKILVKVLADVYEEIFLQQEDQKYLNDVEILCKNGEKLHLPALLLASISPCFRNMAPMAEMMEQFCLIVPDVEKKELETFFKCLCHIDEIPNDPEQIEVLERIMNALCSECQTADETLEGLELFDQDLISSKFSPIKKPTNTENKENFEPDKPKRKVGRKKGQKMNIKSEPYIKTEIMDSHRTSAVYGLRTTVKRKRFTDEVSEPSDLDSEEEDEAFLDSSDEYAPDDDKAFEEEEEPSEEEDELLEDDLENDSDGVVDESELLDSDDEIIDASVDMKKELKSKDHDSFTVRVCDDGTIEVISQEEASAASETPNKPRPRGRPRKRPKVEDSELVGIGRVVSVMEDEDASQLAFKGKKIYAAAKSNPKSLLKPSGQAPLPLILFCSVCEAQCNGQAELRHHVANHHKGSKFFVMPKNNPHRECAPCQVLMKSYEALIEQEDPGEFTQKDVCFPCPHCRRRYLGHLGGLTSHLINDHRNTISNDLCNKSEDYYFAIKRTDEKVLTCDFCKKILPHSTALNKHLISCPANDSGCSAGLFCHICGKMFAQQRYLKDHLSRHGKDQVNRPRDFMCGLCPVTCISEANLNKHMDREHSNKDPDDDFVLHEGCERCTCLFQSYLDNKATLNIPFREMVFKCPHCCMVLYANHKHAPRYLFNHINKFHTDPDINDFTLGGQDPSEFRLRSKTENDSLTCEFCGFTSKTRANHNVHLSTCKQSTVPCRPGYMCDTVSIDRNLAKSFSDVRVTSLIFFLISVDSLPELRSI